MTISRHCLKLWMVRSNRFVCGAEWRLENDWIPRLILFYLPIISPIKSIHSRLAVPYTNKFTLFKILTLF